MNISAIENAFATDDFNFYDCLHDKIRQYDIISYVRGNKYFIYLVLDFINDREIKCISLENLSTGRISKIILSSYKNKILIVTNQMLTHNFYGKKFESIIENHKNGLPLVQLPKSVNNTKRIATRYFVLLKFLSNTEVDNILNLSDINDYLDDDTKYRFDQAKLNKDCICSLYAYQFDYEFNNKSVGNAIDTLLHDPQYKDELNRYFIFTKFGYVSLEDVKSLKIKDLNFYSLNGLGGQRFSHYITGGLEINVLYIFIINQFFTLYKKYWYNYIKNCTTYTISLSTIQDAYNTNPTFLNITVNDFYQTIKGKIHENHKF